MSEKNHIFQGIWFSRFLSGYRKTKRDVNVRRLVMEPLEERYLLTVTSVTSQDEIASESAANQPNYGVFLIERDVADSTSEQVWFQLSGTASYGSSNADYTLYDAQGN